MIQIDETYDQKFVLLVRHVCQPLYCQMLLVMVSVSVNVNENNVYSNVPIVDNDHVHDLDLDMIDHLNEKQNSFVYCFLK